MEIDWEKIILPEELVNSILFNHIATNSLINVWPGKSLTLWRNYYDNWHRHLIPLSSFLIPIQQAIDLYGLPYFSPSEDPIKIKEMYNTNINIYNKEKTKLENTIISIKYQIEISNDKYQKINLEHQLSLLILELKFLYKPVDSTEYIIRDYEDRQTLMKAAKNKYDVRWYMLLHHCWSNAKMIYLILSTISPENKWNVIVSRSHALVTNGNIEDLDNYLHNYLHKNIDPNFYIADPIISVLGNFKEYIRNLMPDMKSWKILTNKDEIYKTDFSKLCT